MCGSFFAKISSGCQFCVDEGHATKIFGTEQEEALYASLELYKDYRTYKAWIICMRVCPEGKGSNIAMQIEELARLFIRSGAKLFSRKHLEHQGRVDGVDEM